MLGKLTLSKVKVDNAKKNQVFIKCLLVVGGFVLFSLKAKLMQNTPVVFLLLIPITDIEHELFLKAKYFTKLNHDISVTLRIKSQLHCFML